jgi:intraflagellar transport protein 88
MHDAGVLALLGALFAKCGDETKALYYYTESHRVHPVNMDIITFLGAVYVQEELYEKAIPIFKLASKIQPDEV